MIRFTALERFAGKKLTEEEVTQMVRDLPEIIQIIEEPTSEQQVVAVQHYPYLIAYIKNPCDEAFMYSEMKR